MISDDDDEDFGFHELSDEENEEFQKEHEEERLKLKSHPLYVQAFEILQIIEALLESSRDESIRGMYGQGLREAAMIIMAKLSSGLTSDSYEYCMQKASLIRDQAEYLRLSDHLFTSLDAFDPRYVKMFREEMEKFRELFKEWAAEIHKLPDEFPDEWGLFVKGAK